MNVSEFNFDLPEELIAQEALKDRAESRLLVMDRKTGQIRHSKIKELGDFLQAGDLIVANNSKVLPARLLGQTSARLKAECFLLKRLTPNSWEALVRPGKKILAGDKIFCQREGRQLVAEVVKKISDGKVVLNIPGRDVDQLLEIVGHVPLPPYIKRDDTELDRERYQTMFAKNSGSVAAPTAGLHFTPRLLGELKVKGVEVAEITLHVGYGTFKPIRTENVEDHELDFESYEISAEAAATINKALQDGRRIIAVGTTTTRTLESIARQNNGQIVAGMGTTNLFIYPGFDFRVISGLLTNFHLPASSLIMLVSAFAGRDQVLSAYGQAIENKYRFYSYGDAMLIL